MGDYAHSRDLLAPIAVKTNEDFVLNNARLGSATLAMYDLTGAEAAFLRAYEVLNSLGVNNGGRSIGAVLVDEQIKIWRGEPYERAMANFYLGLVYYMQRDYNNARGAFENALFKLRDYAADEENQEPQPDKYKEVESNFALAQFLLARCFQRLGQDDLAKANYKRMTDSRPELAPLANWDANAKANVVLIVDYGSAPQKTTDFDGALVGFEPTPQTAGPIPMPQVHVDDGYAPLFAQPMPLVDLVTLAQDRKWQSIDTIRAVKSALGTGLIAGGAYGLANSESGTAQAVSGALILTGLLLKATSQADVRVWETLPRSTFVIPLALTPGKHDISVGFPVIVNNYPRQRADGAMYTQPITTGGYSQTWHNLTVPESGEVTYYFRLQGGAVKDATWPPATITGWNATALPPQAEPSSP